MQEPASPRCTASSAVKPPSVASSSVKAEFLNQLTVLASDRTQRIVDTRPRMPALLWAAVVFGAIVLVKLMGFLRLGSTTGHAIVSSAIAVLLGLLLCIVFSFDHPFAAKRKLTSGRSSILWRCSTRSTAGHRKRHRNRDGSVNSG